MQKVIYLYFNNTYRCNEILATPTGGKLELRDGVHIKRKAE
jgi:ribosomal protein S27E